MPTLNRIRVHPIKSLDAIDVETASIARGGLEYDRKYALFDADDEYVSRKDTDRLYALRTDFDRESEEVTVRNEGRAHVFDMETERDELEAWFSEFLGEAVAVDRASDTRFTGVAGGAIPLQISAPGPSVVSTATYREVASWFDGLDVEDVRRRFRANLEIGGVPAFWEDRLFSDKDHVVEFRVGEVSLIGVLPLSRCSVPTKDPRTGDRIEGFAEKFAERREERFPEWVDADHLGEHLPTRSGHYFYLTVVTRVPSSENGGTIEVGDEVEIVGETATVRAL